MVKMAKEIDSELSLSRIDLSHRTLSLDQLHNLLAVATTSIQGEVRIDYLREQKKSTVQAVVQIKAKGSTGDPTLEADVQLNLTYKGDTVRFSPAVRKKIEHRLKKLAQKHCAEEAYKIIIEASSSN